MVAHLLGGDPADPGHAGRLLGDEHGHPAELEGAEPARVEHVGQQPRVVDVEVAALRAGLDGAGQHGQAAADGLAEAVHRALADLLEEVATRAAHDRLRAVHERRVGQAVVDEAPRPGARAARAARRRPGGLLERHPQLVEVLHQREAEELLLAGEVAVDDRPVDADGPGDVLDLGVADAALVEEPAGRGDDLGLAEPPPRGRGAAAPGAGRGRRLGAHGGQSRETGRVRPAVWLMPAWPLPDADAVLRLLLALLGGRPARRLPPAGGRRRRPLRGHGAPAGLLGRGRRLGVRPRRGPAVGDHQRPLRALAVPRRPRDAGRPASSARRSSCSTAAATVAMTVRGVRLRYASMYRTDLAVYELRETYADLAAGGVTPLSLATEGPSRGDEIRIPSGYWLEQRACTTTGTAYRLHEREWDWWARSGCRARRLRDPGWLLRLADRLPGDRPGRRDRQHRLRRRPPLHRLGLRGEPARRRCGWSAT